MFPGPVGGQRGRSPPYFHNDSYSTFLVQLVIPIPRSRAPSGVPIRALTGVPCKSSKWSSKISLYGYPTPVLRSRAP